MSETTEQAVQRLLASRVEQGLPATVTDPVALAVVAAALGEATPVAGSSDASGAPAGVSGQRDRLTLARSCLNRAAYLLRQVERDMAPFDGGEAAELHGIARDCAEKAEAGRDGVRRFLGEATDG